MFDPVVYYILAGLLVFIIMFGIFLMSNVKYAKIGNILSAFAMLLAVLLTILQYEIIDKWIIFPYLGVGALIGIYLAYRVKMIEMPEMVALLNGLGGLASLVVGAFAYFNIGVDISNNFSYIVAIIALMVGTITFVGSLIAALKLHRIISGRPVRVKFYKTIITILFTLQLVAIVISPFKLINDLLFVVLLVVISTLFSLVFTLRIGGADMPITISLLNSFSGVAGAISGLAIGDVLLVAVGGIVGASGLILTKIMCQAMNKTLIEILLGKTSSVIEAESDNEDESTDQSLEPKEDFKEIFLKSRSVIIVPGYGMAVAQAQQLVKNLADIMKKDGKTVKFAIHPVAGRMPGHMNVLLAEANVDYDDLYDMEVINNEFKTTDLVLIVGANDVVNPKAKTHEGTPIYGMPVLDVEDANNIFIFNYDLKPGYSGVSNPLYKLNKAHLFLGDAKETLKSFMDDLKI